MSEQNYQAFWNEVLNIIHEEYKQKGQEDEFKLWFNMEYVKDTLSEITVSVPSEFMWNSMVQKGYVKSVQEKIKEMTGQDVSITHIAKNSFSVPSDPVIEQKKDETDDKMVIQNTSSSVSYKKHPQLDELFTFDTFIPGENSDFAYKVAYAAAENPGGLYSPLLIYGGVGLGKTHLMQSIGNYLYNKKQGKIKICYVTSENFTNEFLKSINDKTTEKFKTKYRNLDVLLIDDIHFLIGKDGTQEELFHTFEALHQNKAQIVFTCDRPVTELKGMYDRLTSRIKSGTSVDLLPPNYETRLAILQNELNLMNKKISPDVVEYIAKNVQTNVREMKACLITMLNYAELMKKDLTIEIAEKQLRNTVSQISDSSITVDIIQKVVADHYNISISEMKGRKKHNTVVIPRQIAIYITRELCDYSYPELGNEFGGKDHTTIMHSYNKVVDQLKTDSLLDSTIQMLIRKIKEYPKKI